MKKFNSQINVAKIMVKENQMKGSMRNVEKQNQ